MLKETQLYYYDNNLNKWAKSHFTKEQAKKHSDSLTNCVNCTNCYECYKCQKCTECDHCDKCSNCNCCSDCSNCKDCNNCNIYTKNNDCRYSAINKDLM